MSRLTNELITAGGLVGCCAAAIQIAQLSGGQAAPDLLNYLITGATGLVGAGLSGFAAWLRRTTAAAPPNDCTLMASLDPIFAYFADDEAAKESVRVVARAITERRFRTKQG
jgi:hypothetical protein